MIVRRLLILLLFVLAPLPVAATPAYACSCKAAVGLDRADLVFVGVVERIEAGAGSRTIDFTVESVIKGDERTEVTLTTSDNEASCGYRFDEGGRYRVLSTAGETTLCSGNEIVTATPAYTARVERVTSDRIGVFWAGTGVVALVVLTGLAMLLRPPRGR